MGIADDSEDFAALRRTASRTYVTETRGDDAPLPEFDRHQEVEQPPRLVARPVEVDEDEDANARQHVDPQDAGHVVVWEAPEHAPSMTPPMPSHSHRRVYGFTGELNLDGDTIAIVEGLVASLRQEHAADMDTLVNHRTGELEDLGHAVRAILLAARDLPPAKLAEAIASTADGTRTSRPKREAEERAEEQRLEWKKQSREAAAQQAREAEADRALDAEDEAARAVRRRAKLEEMTTRAR